MLLRSFTVQGFKNFTQLVELPALGRVNVLHGENNTGKSNLLEAIGLFFFLLSYVQRKERKEPDNAIKLKQLRLAGFPVEEIFHHEHPGPIHLSGILGLSEGIDRQVTLAISPLSTRDREEFVLFESDISPISLPPGPAELMARRSFRRVKDGDAYRMITVERRLVYGAGGIGDRSGLEPTADRDHVPPELARLLFDLRQERSPVVDRFLGALQRFHDLLPGTPDIVYLRNEERARIVFDPPERKGPPVRSHLLGAGTQQIIALLGQAVVAGVPILAIEEPERGLRYSLQTRLRDALLALLSSSGEQFDQPQQLFITSHTDAFEEPAKDATFYALTRRSDGYQITLRNKKDAAQFVGLTPMTQPGDGPAPLCYVTSEGRVRLPGDVRDFLQIREGGGVCFLPDEATGEVRMLTNAQFLDQIEPLAVVQPGTLAASSQSPIRGSDNQ